MKTTERFNNAVNKLYKAYSNGTLDSMDCKHCAVGNLCCNEDSWASIGTFGTVDRISKDFINKTNYSNIELAQIEYIFLYGDEINSFSNTISNYKVKIGYATKQQQKELQLKGLIMVIKYLAELDGIDNQFNFKRSFKRVFNKEKGRIRSMALIN